MTMGADFWVSSGHHLVDRSEGGGLVATEAFLSAYLARPELMPPPEACPVEHGLHAELLAAPRAAISPEALALVADADARENLGLFLAFRDRLLVHPTLESAWLSLARHGAGGTPPLFLQHLTHLVARNAFDATVDARVLRAAECFWRPQRVTFHDGSVLLADEETIAGHEHVRTHSPLMSMLGGPAVSELEVLTDENAATYRGRSDAYDMAYDLTHPERGRQAFGEAMAIFTRHLLGFSPDYRPIEALSEARVSWFLSLDSDGTAFGNRIWNGEALGEDERQRVLALFSFTLPDHPRILSEKRGREAFAIMGSTADRMLRIKPQNLIAGLPLAPDAG